MRVEFLKKLYPIQVGANNPILRSKSEPIKKIDDEIKHFGEILETLMFEYDGV
jgi:peptide deformylase